MKKSNNERKLREEAQKLKEIEKHVSELKEIIKSTTSTTTSTQKAPKAMLSNQVSDVEYDDDSIEDSYEDRFNEIPTMALQAASNKYKSPDVRDFAIDMWNGSPGLKYWGYNESGNAE